MGQHWIQRIVADTPSTRFTETMMNQTTHLTHPSDIRKRVAAKEVLLHAAPKMVAKPARYERKYTMGDLSGSMSS
jgi:hypothetical protein